MPEALVGDVASKVTPVNRIVNGFPAEENQFPFQVSLLAPYDDGRYFVCSGAIISEDYVLAAAHCTYPHPRIILRFQSKNLWSGGFTQEIPRDNIVNHPTYNETSLANDVSVIRLPQRLTLEAGRLEAIRLPGRSVLTNLFVGQRGRVAGWGIDNSGEISATLNFVDLEVITNTRCRRAFGARVNDNVICGLGWHTDNQATCGADSGAALAAQINNQWVHIGGAAFGALNACARFPSGFVRTTNYVEWINQVTNIPIAA